MKRFLIALFSALFLFSGVIAAHAKELKVAYVDLDKVFEEYNKTKDAYKALDDKLKVKETERKKMVEEVRRLKDELDLLSDKGKEEKQIKIDEKIGELNEFTRKAQDEFKKERMNAIRDISNEIDIVMQQYGKAQGYDYIFSSRALVFGKDENDVTNDILKTLNAKPSAGKK